MSEQVTTANTRERGSSAPSLVVVANRLPFDVRRNPDGSVSVEQSPGGLVTALAPLLARADGAWIGWDGSVGDGENDPAADLPPVSNGVALEPMPLSRSDIDGYYEGFSNATLWPLYHDAVAAPEFHRQWWDSYVAVNRRFAERAAQVAGPDAIVWVHDYQLQLVPQLLRRLRPDVRIGFFLHIPFPPAELFMRLPRRAEIVAGLLGADLVGFQLPGGARNFVGLARRLIGAATTGGTIEHDGRTIRAAAFPISIDSKAQAELAAQPEVRRQAAQLRAELGNPRRLILGVDRLDYTKGIDVRLAAYQELLAEHEPAVEQTVMVQIATPSRERLASYAHMREVIERQVGALNGDFGQIGRPAVHYLRHSLPREDLAAFYVAADVMAVTPLRDGMNLVAKEYAASRLDGTGVLLLSEFTGAAHELRSAVLVNPYDTDAVKEGLRTALTMPEAEARQRMRSLHRQVLSHDVDRWANAFLGTLRSPGEPVVTAASRLPAGVVKMARRIATAETLLVATDFDGTLAPLVDDPRRSAATPGSLEALHGLAALPGTSVAVISGRSLADLHTLLGDTGGLYLVGSHGAEFGGPPLTAEDGDPGRAGQLLAPPEQAALAALVRRIGLIADRYPRSRVELKPTGVAVHLRTMAATDAAALAAELDELVLAESVRVMHGKKVVEMSVIDADKGTALAVLRRATDSRSVIFIGDDTTDERAFAVLRSGDLGVKVGPGPTGARARIDSPVAVVDLLGVVLSARSARSLAVGAG